MSGKNHGFQAINVPPSNLAIFGPHWLGTQSDEIWMNDEIDRFIERVNSFDYISQMDGLIEGYGGFLVSQVYSLRLLAVNLHIVPV